MEPASPAFRWILYHWAVGKPLHPLLLLECLCCYFETSPCTMILKSYDKDLWGPHWGMETLLLFLICEWNVDTYNSMIPGENHCSWFKLLHVWRLIPIVLCQPVHTLKTSLDFWPLKKKKEQLVFLFWGFVFLSCHHLLCLVCPFLDTHAQVLASSSPHSYNLLSPLRSWPHGRCFKCSGLVHLQNLKTRGLWAHLTLKFLKSRDFPGGAVVKTLRSEFKGLGVQSLVRELDPTRCN